jgi:hypothetical protein
MRAVIAAAAACLMLAGCGSAGVSAENLSESQARDAAEVRVCLRAMKQSDGVSTSRLPLTDRLDSCKYLTDAQKKAAQIKYVAWLRHRSGPSGKAGKS